MPSKPALFAVASVLALGLSACGTPSQDASSASSSTSSSTSSSSSSTATSGDSSSASSPAAAEVVITISDFDYTVPASVAPGAMIMVKNDDKVAHTVTATGDGGFDVKIDGGGSATFMAPVKAGSFPFTCTFHANMKGTLVVKG